MIQSEPHKNYLRGFSTMKLLTLIVHTHVQQRLTELLRGIEQVPGFTFTHVEGHGNEVEGDDFVSSRDEVVGYIPRMRTDILLEDSDVDTVLESLRVRENSIIGQGVYWVTAIEQGGHIL
jgi:nitrogen regulatory protein P-II 1